MNKLAVLVVVLLAIGAYIYRDRIIPTQIKADSPQKIYSWKDKDGRTHYSSDKSSAPADAKTANLPEISIIETDKAELEKQAKRLKEKDAPAESNDIVKPRLPEVRNLALERMEKAAGNLKK
jgi:Domain of unknown function (DUF4124)